MNCKYYSHSVGCLFNLLIVSTEAQIFKISWSPIHLFFSFVACSVGVIPEKPSPSPRPQRFMLSSHSCVVLAPTYRPLFCLELFFMYGVEWIPVLFFCMWISSCLSTVAWKEDSFPTKLSWRLDQNQLPIYLNVGVYFRMFGSIPLTYIPVLMLGPLSPDYCSFMVSIEVGKCESPYFVLFQDCFGWSFHCVLIICVHPAR